MLNLEQTLITGLNWLNLHILYNSIFEPFGTFHLKEKIVRRNSKVCDSFETKVWWSKSPIFDLSSGFWNGEWIQDKIKHTTSTLDPSAFIWAHMLLINSNIFINTLKPFSLQVLSGTACSWSMIYLLGMLAVVSPQFSALPKPWCTTMSNPAR